MLPWAQIFAAQDPADAVPSSASALSATATLASLAASATSTLVSAALAPPDSTKALASTSNSSVLTSAAGLSGGPMPPEAGWEGEEHGAYIALMVLNSISAASCLMVLTLFFLARKWYPRIMRRLSLRLVACMACAELVLHTSNLVGYGKLPTDGFICGLFGGFFFAFGSLTSLLYATAVGLNCLLVFVFAKRPGQTKEKLFLMLPPIITLAICMPSLASGIYGYDEELEYCWYATSKVTPQVVLARMLGTFGLWVFICLAFLIVACSLIIRAVFSRDASYLQVSATVDGFAAPSQTSDVISRRRTAIHRLVFRLLGFIIVPAVCVGVGVILDILVKSGHDVSPTIDALFEVISGLAGTFNGVLFLIDPAMLAIKDNRWKAVEDDQMRPRPFTLSPWTARVSDESLDVEKSIIQDARSRRFKELESDLDGL